MNEEKCFSESRHSHFESADGDNRLRKIQSADFSLYTLCDKFDIISDPSRCRLPMASFNHIAREVLDLDKSMKFYCDILGFHVIPRPTLGCGGSWLNGYGLNLHLVCTKYPEYRQQLKKKRIEHFSTALPRVDHIAFVAGDLTNIRKVLYEAHVFIKEDQPKDTGIEQIFLFDPDGNVIEISNCGPPPGETTCKSADTDIKDVKGSRADLCKSTLQILKEAGLSEEDIVTCFRSI